MIDYVVPLALVGGLVTAGVMLLKACGCRHLWQVVVEKEFPSIIERIAAANGRWESAPKDDFRRLHYTILRCDKCGALKTFEVRQ